MIPQNPPASAEAKLGPGYASEERQQSDSQVLGLERVLRHRDALIREIFEAKDLARTLRWFLLTTLALSGFYGLTMGFAAFQFDLQRGILQMLASGLKVPLLYLASLLVCYPVLYIVVVLRGSRLDFRQTLGLILMALTLNAVLLASCAPISLFFVATGADYHFIKLLHVLIFGFSGAWSMMALWHGLVAMCEKSDLYPRKALGILMVWLLVFGFVGTQMAWTLRPFVGEPSMEFQILRDQEGNFYKAVWQSFVKLVND